MKKPAVTLTQLPPDVLEADTQYPKYDANTHLGYAELEKLGLDSNHIQLYQVKDIGWVVTTLHISNGSKTRASASAARTYSIGVADGKVWRVGKGPHVLKELSLYLTKDNVERLKKYVDLFLKGLEAAGTIRDRISSRRAQGQLYRQQGRTSWMW